MPHTLLYFLALFCLSTSANWAKFNHMPVDVLGLYRLGTAALLLGIWLLVFRRKQFSELFKKEVLWVLLSGFFFFLHLWTFKFAAKNTSISNSMIIFSSNPVWTSLGAVLFFKEKIHPRLLISYLLALISIYILVGHNLTLHQQGNLGDLSSVVSAFLFALYMLTGKKARQHFENKFYALIQYGVCAFCFAICIVFTKSPLTGYDTGSWVAIIGLVLMPTFFGHFSMTYLVNYMNISLMTCGKLVEPVMASVIAWFVFNESLSPNAPYAFILTSTAVLILFYPNLKKALRFS